MFIFCLFYLAHFNIVFIVKLFIATYVATRQKFEYKNALLIFGGVSSRLFL